MSSTYFQPLQQLGGGGRKQPFLGYNVIYVLSAIATQDAAAGTRPIRRYNVIHILSAIATAQRQTNRLRSLRYNVIHILSAIATQAVEFADVMQSIIFYPKLS